MFDSRHARTKKWSWSGAWGRYQTCQPRFVRPEATVLRVITKFLRTTRKQLRSNAYSNLATVAGARGGSILAALLVKS